MLIDIKFDGEREDGETYEASGQYDTEKNELTIRKESRWTPTVTQGDEGARQWIEVARKNLVESGKVDADTGVFKDDYIHTTKKENNEETGYSGTPISSAAGIICGTARRADSCWKIAEDPKKQLFKRLEELGVVERAGKNKNRQWVAPMKRKALSNAAGSMPAFPEESEQTTSANAPQENSESLNKKISKEIEGKGFLRQNVIFYGVPGCGKSHRINELLHLDDEENGLEKEYYKRILFHPEYSYSDFVGQLHPVTEGKNITYQFFPGPFTEILRDAYLNPENDYFLIIEEINRGNAPAIFGDLFQLLDRKDGVSECSIDNKDILDYFKFKRESKKDDTGAMAQAVETIKREGVRIPENLTIFATMNTCDQNVFTLDTAFKRRWRMSRIVNDFDKDSSISEWKISFKSGGFSWKEFAKAVNDAILNNCNDGTAAEDKQLGTHFIKQCDLTPARRFAEKVMLYLWDDVAKYDKSQLFDTNKYKTLDMVIDGFAKGENVFSPNCAQLQELYNNMKQPGQTDNNAAGVPSGAAPGTDSSVKNAATDEVQGIE